MASIDELSECANGLRGLPYYRGNISNDDAVGFLNMNMIEGEFIVRDCPLNRNEFILMVFRQGSVHDHTIFNSGDKFSLDMKRYYDTLEELITYHQNNVSRIIKCKLDRDMLATAIPINRIPWKLFHIYNEIQGDFGPVYIAKYYSKTVALQKIVFINTVTVSLNHFICHENLVNWMGLTCDQISNYLITAYYENSKLEDILRNSNQELITPEVIINYACDICTGMEYLDRMFLSNKSLCTRNIVVNCLGIAKLTNFDIMEVPTDTIRILSMRWEAPEVLMGISNTTMSDAWTIAVTIWEIYTFGGIPYENVSHLNLADRLKDGLRLEKPDNCPSECFDVLFSCWKLDPTKRPNFEELKEFFLEQKRHRYVLESEDATENFPE